MPFVSKTLKAVNLITLFQTVREKETQLFLKFHYLVFSCFAKSRGILWWFVVFNIGQSVK